VSTRGTARAGAPAAGRDGAGRGRAGAGAGTGPGRAGAGSRGAGAGSRGAGAGSTGAGSAAAGTGSAGAGAPAEPTQGRPLTISAAVVIEALEAALVAVAAVLAGVDTGAGKSYQLSSGIAITVIGVATAVLLGLVAAGLRQPRRWTRTPALLTQLFTGIIGIYLLQGGRYNWGVPTIVLALAGFAVLLAPPSTKALTAGMPQPADRHRRRPG
jgi:hypothetical protein